MQQAPLALQPGLVTLARLKYLIGEQLVRVGPVAPDLGASLASVAIAQTSFGQARYFYNWHRGESRAADDEFVIDESWAREMGLLRFDERSTWPHLIAALWLVDEALNVLMDDWVRADQKLASALAKVREEIAQTLVFTKAWVRIFLQQGGGLRRVVLDVEQSLGRALQELLEELGSTSGENYVRQYRAVMGGDVA
ncbi:MAG: hypothetical protein C7B45_10065 [Sulfobacillus acidophilus]|uniref:Uncharacterized protein n=1 Tax=Sulfobacillus acidophilus TaxID=53633 RepID=A0A2T2WHD9_9FIRM|nr:MAG: hypothetical protein C7B45_10065 [Sulfobacillus acidophilus]